MALFVMALTSLIIGSEMVRNRELKSTKSVLGALAIFTLLGLGIALTFGLGFAARVGEMMTVRLMQADDVLNMSSHQVGLLDYYSIYVFLLLLLVAVILTAERKQPPTAWFARKLSLLVLVPGIFVAYQLIDTYNLDLIRADTIYSLGQKFDGFREWDFTFALYKRAISKAPNEDVYFRGLGAACLGRAISPNSTTPSTGSRFDELTPVQTILDLDVSALRT